MNKSENSLNMQFIKSSRLKRGDIFAIFINNSYVFGRVVDDKLPMMGSHVALLYFYNSRSEKMTIDVTNLTPDNLLIPPVITSRSFWTRGLAVRVMSEPIQSEDLLRQHCFRRRFMVQETYVDELGRKIIKENNDPCNDWAVLGIGSIDDMLSDALGIKRAPLQEEDIWYISGKGEKIWLKQPVSELKKYSNYEEVVKKYPEIIEK